MPSSASMEEALFVERNAPNHAQLHRRRRCLHGHLGNITFLISSRKERQAGRGRKRQANPWPKFPNLDATSRETTANPMTWLLGKTNTTPALELHLIARDGFETPIEDSAAPIHDREGLATGAVIVFRDVSAARAMAVQMAIRPSTTF